MAYDNLKLSKDMLFNSNKNLSQVLEELDPSINYKGTHLEKTDAFQRQLFRYGIKTTGANSDLVSKFFDRPETEILCAECLCRSCRQGMLSANSNALNQLVASTISINSDHFRNGALENNVNKFETIKENGQIKPLTYKLKDSFTKLNKFVRAINLSYESFYYQNIDTLLTQFKFYGAHLANSLIESIVNLILNGDGNDNAAAVLKIKKNPTFQDIISINSLITDFNANTILISPDVFAKLISIKELQNPLTGVNYVGTGNFSKLFGADVIVSKFVPKDHYIVLDKNFAIQQLISKDISIDINKQPETQQLKISIYTIRGFAKLIDNACSVATLTA